MNIREVFEELKIPYVESGHHHCRPGWIQIDCPWCGKDTRRFHLGFNQRGRYFNCWKCGGHSTPAVLQKLGVPHETVLSLTTHIDIAGTPVSRERTKISLKEPDGLGPLLSSHRRYLAERGFDPDVIAGTWNVQGIGLAPRLSWRLYIPIILHGVKVSWTTRAIGDRIAQRYISASAEEEVENHKHLIYGEDFCHHSIVIVEGPIDAWAIGPGAGALFGTAFSTTQVRRLTRFPCRYVCFDSTEEAQKKATNLAGQLSCFPGLTENIVLDAKDPGEASQKELRLIRKLARL